VAGCAVSAFICRMATLDATREQIAAENIRTGQFRKARLIHFAPYRPRFDSDAFDEMVRKGTQAWKGVDNPTEWHYRT
jgi:hypothetical protein